MTSSVRDGVRRDVTPRARVLRDRARWAARTPPGRLSAMAVGLMVLCLAAGLAGAVEIAQRRAVLTEVTQRSIPLAGAALDVYQSLSEADATANSVFLAGDQAGADERAGYLTKVDQAAIALSTAATGASTETAHTVALLTAQLTKYSGLVETAHTNNRHGFSVGAAYLREASALARDTLLPTAHRLYRQELDRLATAQRAAGSPAWLAITFCVLVLAAFVAVQLYLRETTRRTLNRGLLVSTGAVLVSIGWLATASLTAAGHSDEGLRGMSQTEALAEARITALTARSTEALALVARSSAGPYEDAFGQARQTLEADKGRLGSLAAAADRVGAHPEAKRAADDAISVWGDWRELHEQNRADPAAADLSRTATLAAQLDERLAVAFQHAKQTFENGAVNAVDALGGADFAVVVWMLIAAAAAGLGMAPRIREYR